MKNNNTNTSTSNKLIFTNTLILYFRLIITLGIALYTSRIVLNVLGVEDFGLYNVVGGMVALFSFFSASMQSATQRFLMFDLGQKDHLKFNKTFNANVQLYIIIGLLVFVLAETLGFWYFTQKAKIPENKLDIFLIVYHISICSYCFSILRIPYSSGIIAQEKMSFYAYTAIFESVLKLAFVFLLVSTDHNKIIYFASTILILTLIINLIYFIYCSLDKRKLYKLSLILNKETIKPIISFSGWRMLGSTSQMIEQNGIVLLINYFFSATANASYAIATQVNIAINNLVSSFQQAFYPQITKRYADNNFQELNSLVLVSGKISFYLLAIISIPFILNIEYILFIWLNKVPDYSTIFTLLVIACSLIDVFSAPLWMLILSTGKIAKYQIYLSLITLLMFLITWIFILNGSKPSLILIVKAISSVIILKYRYYLLKYYYKIHVKGYLINSVLKPLLLFVSVLFVIYNITLSSVGFEKLIITLFTELILFPISIYLLLSSSQKLFLKNVLREKLSRN